MALVGRGEECAALDALLATARSHASGTLVMRGEAGVGKTALIDYAIGAASDFLVVRFTGAEAESQLGYAALHRLLTPILHQIQRLPVPQRDALNSALGWVPGPPANPFLVGLGTISLAANAARAAGPLLTVIDDAQWVDRESLAALAFWGRRIHSEGIALVFAERALPPSPALAGFNVLEVRGLDTEAGVALLSEATQGGVDRHVASQIVAGTDGNPLALVELAKELSPEQLVGASPLPQPLPITRGLEDHFSRQVRLLPIAAQMFLPVAAADSSTDLSLVARAATLMGGSIDDASPAEAAGLLKVGNRLKFRHPLIRSAVYTGARSSDRRAVHRALADATGAADPERRAWHLAAATLGHDDQVAAALAGCALRAGERGSHAAQAALFTRAAELTSDRHRAADRRLEAARAAMAGGAPQQAMALVELARPGLHGPLARARADRAAGRALMGLGQAAAAAPRLLSAALALLPSDVRVGRHALLETLEALHLSGVLAPGRNGTVKEAAGAALGSSPDLRSEVDLLLDGLATWATDGFVAAVPLVRSSVDLMRSTSSRVEEVLRWTLAASNACWALWDQEAHDEIMRRLATVSRERGALPWLRIALQCRATSEMWSGRFGAADALLDEARELARMAGQGGFASDIIGIELCACRGQEAQTRIKAEIVKKTGEATGMGASTMVADLSLVTLHLGAGRYDRALEHARSAFDADLFGLGNKVLPDMVEAAARAGDTAAATAALTRLSERAAAAATPCALGLLARSEALMRGDEAERLFDRAVEALASTRMIVELARTQLLYGEWLRRQKRRSEARVQLRAAFDALDSMGASAFANRARMELLATGEHARRRSPDTGTELTHQESRIARLAAAGETNADIAAQLFLSTNTVEYHLRKVFRKLAITSRRQLKKSLPCG